MVIGESSMPQTCIKNDEVALMTFFRELHYIPLPDHSGRQVRLCIDHVIAQCRLHIVHDTAVQ